MEFYDLKKAHIPIANTIIIRLANWEIITTALLVEKVQIKV